MRAECARYVTFAALKLSQPTAHAFLAFIRYDTIMFYVAITGGLPVTGTWPKQKVNEHVRMYYDQELASTTVKSDHVTSQANNHARFLPHF